MRYLACGPRYLGGLCCLRLGRLPRPTRRKKGTDSRRREERKKNLFRSQVQSLENNLRKTLKKIAIEVEVFTARKLAVRRLTWTRNGSKRPEYLLPRTT